MDVYSDVWKFFAKPQNSSIMIAPMQQGKHLWADVHTLINVN